jgi:CrcB protein
MHSVIAISLGAVFGALARWRLSLWLNQGAAVLPWGTLAANWIGAYLIGLAVVFFQSQTQIDPAWRLAIITGFLGGLTTFSAFSAEVVGAVLRGEPGWALATAAAHLLGSLALTALGIATVRLLAGP